MNIIEYGINVLIFGSVFIASFLFEIGANGIDHFLKFKSYNDKLDLVYLGFTCIGVLLVQRLQVRFNYYSPMLLAIYIGFLWITYNRLYIDSGYFLQSLSVAVLLVFFNSYLWEIILHLSVYHINIYELFNFRELWRLSALYILARYYTIKKEKKNDLMLIVKIIIFINFLFSVLYIHVFWAIPNKIILANISLYELKMMFMYSNRVISLTLLTDIFKNCLTLRSKIKWWFL
jgi:hypothetical protein